MVTHQTKANNQNNLIRFSLTIFGILFSFTTLSAVIMANLHANATNPASANASVFVSSACTMSGGNNDYVDTMSNGESKVFGPSTIKAVCNDASGLAIYAVGYSGDTITGGDNDKMLARATGSSNNIVTATDDNPGSGSYWAMRITAVSGTYTPTIENSFDRTAYHIVPTAMTKVASLSSATDQGESATGSSINANYKVSIASAQPADTYQGKVKYVLVHPNTFIIGTYDVNFYANGGTGTLASQTNLANYEDQTLNPISSGTITPPAGYRFVGWCDATESTPSTPTNPQTTCPGNLYTDGDIVLASSVAGSGSSTASSLNLYAVYAHYSELALINTNATVTGSTSTTILRGQTATSTPITNPQRSYTVSGLEANGVGGTGATVTFPSTGACTSTTNCTYNYIFSGWYTATSGGTKIINPDSTLTPSNGYTDNQGAWNSDDTPTLHAQWDSTTPPAITLPTITKAGHTCGWATSNSTTTRTYESGQTIDPLTANTTLYGTCSANSYTITLNQNGATTSSSPTSVNATYNQSTLSSAITNPSKTYSASGFTMGTYASGATVTFPSTGNCTSASNCTYTNTFNGWYNTSSATGGTQIITTAGALTPSNGWTDANANWTSTSDQTVYTRWSAGTSITLPTITKTGYNCGWSENSSASTYTYESGYSGLTLDSNKTLYGICEIKSNLSLKVSLKVKKSESPP